jgi:hypothetical protein
MSKVGFNACSPNSGVAGDHAGMIRALEIMTNHAIS